MMELVPDGSLMRSFIKKLGVSFPSSSQGQGNELAEAPSSLVKRIYQATAIVSPSFPLIG